MSTTEKSEGISKFIDNKQMIHIACEVVVLLGVTFYFSSKNKRLMSHIEELAQTIEQQEDRIQKLEQGMGQLTSEVSKSLEQFAHTTNTHETAIARLYQNKRVPRVPQDRKASVKKEEVVTTRNPTPPPPQPVKHFSNNNKNKIEVLSNLSEDEEISDTELDEEIREELEELEEK